MHLPARKLCWLGFFSLIMLSGCLFSGEDPIVEKKLSDYGWDSSLKVKRQFVEGAGLEQIVEPVADSLLFHSTRVFAWDSYTSPYRNYWRPHMTLGKRFGVARSLHLLFDVTDTVELAAGEVNSLFLEIDHPDSLQLQLVLPEDTAFFKLLDSAATFPNGKKCDLSLSWRIVEASDLLIADTLRASDTAFAQTFDGDQFSSSIAARAKREHNSQGWSVWVIDLPRELSLDLINARKENSNHRFVVMKLDALDDPPLRLASPFSDSTSAGWKPALMVGDWAKRFALRSAEVLHFDEASSLALRGGVKESLLVHLPIEELLDSLNQNRFANLEEMVVRAKLHLIPPAPLTAQLEGDFGAVPVEARVTVDTAYAKKSYKYTEPQTGNFLDSAQFPKNWVYPSSSTAGSDTLSVEIGEAVRHILFAGDDRGIRVTLFLGRSIINPAVNYQGTNQILPVTLDQVDLGDPALWKWSIELQTVDLQEMP